jgi:hypothetical protein
VGENCALPLGRVAFAQWHGAAGRVRNALLYTKPSTAPPHVRGRGGTRWGSSSSQPPVEFRPYPPCVVEAGSARGARSNTPPPRRPPFRAPPGAPGVATGALERGPQAKRRRAHQTPCPHIKAHQMHIKCTPDPAEKRLWQVTSKRSRYQRAGRGEAAGAGLRPVRGTRARI